MAKVHGIAAGGLFNEIFDAHLKARTTRTEYTAPQSPPAEDFDPFLPGDEEYLEPVTVTRPRYVTVDVSKQHGGLTWLWHLFVSLCAMLVYVMFVAGPIGSSLHPGIGGTFLLGCSAFAVWIGVYYWMKGRWKKKVEARGPELVSYQDGTEQVTEWVPRVRDNTRARRAAVDAQYAQRAAARTEVTRTLYPSLKVDKKWVDKDELKDQMRHLKNYMNSTGNVPNWVNKEVAGFEKIFGAACEVTTSRDIASLNQGEVYNDIVLRGRDGSVSANIDHLLVTGSTAIMLDSKWWSAAPDFTNDRRGRRIVSAYGPHARAVSTCVYEASFLPRTPRAIIFCVRGKAARELGRPQVVQSFNKFVPFEDKPQGVFATPCPVIFTPHDQLKDVVNAVASGGGTVAGVPIPSGKPAPLSSRELGALEVTTALTFER